MSSTAHSLRNPNATRTHHICDVSYIRRDNERMWVVIRQCDFDDIRSMAIEEARKMYRQLRDESGYVPTSEPVYGCVRIDEFNRLSCYRDEAQADECEAFAREEFDRIANL